MEASAIPAKVGLARTRIAIGGPLLRLRSDEQLVTLFRAGSEEAFRAIHDRYRTRMFAYTRQMLAGSAADAEDAVQEIFVRAYGGLRANHRELALRAWLYRIAHNRCVDELRRPQTVPTDEIPATAAGHGFDPVVQMEQRDVLRRLIADVQRLPDQQRSALLMRELGGMTYADVSGALGVSVPAVKSLLVRARVGLAQANEARDTACAQIREDLIVSHDRGVRTSGLARRHMRDCPSCREFRAEVRGVSRQLAAFAPALGPVGVIAKLLGIGGAGGGGAAASSGAVAGGGAAAAVGTGAAASAGAIAGASHVVTLIAAAVVTAGGAYELQHINPAPPLRAHHHHVAPVRPAAGAAASPSAQSSAPAPAANVGLSSSSASQSAPASTAGTMGRPAPLDEDAVTGAALSQRVKAARSASSMPLADMVDPDNLSYVLAHSRTTTGQALDPTGSAATGLATTTPTTNGSASGTSASDTAGSTTAGQASPGDTSSGDTSAGAAAGTSTPASSAGTTGSSSAGTAAGTTAASSGSASSAVPVSTTTTSTGSGGTAAGTTGSAVDARPVVKMTPAAATGPITTRPGRVKTAGKGHGTVAIFTMTGN